MKTINRLSFVAGGHTLLLACLMSFTVNGQVKSEIIQAHNSSKHGIISPKAQDIPTYELPKINVGNLLKEDSIERSQGKPFRFGKAVNVDIDLLASSAKSVRSDTTLYLYKITSNNAYSLNLIFDEFFLSENVELLIYNADKTMVYCKLPFFRTSSN